MAVGYKATLSDYELFKPVSAELDGNTTNSEGVEQVMEGTIVTYLNKKLRMRSYR